MNLDDVRWYSDRYIAIMEVDSKWYKVYYWHDVGYFKYEVYDKAEEEWEDEIVGDAMPFKSIMYWMSGEWT